MIVYNNKKDMKYQDLVYFGYDGEQYSKKYQEDFIGEINQAFPDVQLKDVYDSIKGYRQEIYLKESKSDDYWAWLIAFGWLQFSLTGQLMLMSADQKDKLGNYIDLAKSQYPQKFKS